MSSVVYHTLDKYSMNGRSVWGWFEQRHSKYCCANDVTDDNTNAVKADPSLLHSPTVLAWHMCGIPKVSSFVNHAHLLSIAQQTVFDPKQSKHGSGGAHVQIAFRKFTCPHLEDGRVTTKSISVYMDKVLRQDVPQLRKLLLHMSNGKVDDEDVELLVFHCLGNLDQEEQDSFKDAINLAPNYAKANMILVDYLTNVLTGPVAKVTANLTSGHTKNCCLGDCNLPVCTTL